MILGKHRVFDHFRLACRHLVTANAKHDLEVSNGDMRHRADPGARLFGFMRCHPIVDCSARLNITCSAKGVARQ